jgi:hypothetical protein
LERAKIVDKPITRHKSQKPDIFLVDTTAKPFFFFIEWPPFKNLTPGGAAF